MSRDFELQLAALSKAEKAELIQRLALEIADTLPGVERVPGVSGGAACIVRTRILVWTLENYRRLGWNESRILANFPSLRAADLVQAWIYTEAHREEIDAAIQENAAA